MSRVNCGKIRSPRWIRWPEKLTTDLTAGRKCNAVGLDIAPAGQCLVDKQSALTAQRDEPLLGRRRDSLNAASITCCPDPTAPAPTPRRPTAAPRREGSRRRPRVPASNVPGPVGGPKSINATAVLRHPRSLQKQGGAGRAK
ncbi:hypothetical protein NDU88_005203 [Pleurodeles waltl]|uniref:Uncharacterized protein n=1 Tax=Pleurodeles waltl TaxID=8319 RepID=A0AAV7MC54_PLEWA|nr:hypothetical protein NDU88_005203 [Pleurodeles waltl]